MDNKVKLALYGHIKQKPIYFQFAKLKNMIVRLKKGKKGNKENPYNVRAKVQKGKKGKGKIREILLRKIGNNLSSCYLG